MRRTLHECSCGDVQGDFVREGEDTDPVVRDVLCVGTMAQLPQSHFQRGFAKKQAATRRTIATRWPILYPRALYRSSLSTIGSVGSAATVPDASDPMA